ncbi:MAG: hypothetical protein LJE62_06465 [Silicimonas sp.]|jgi:hypothetical protein|nr:hypothetical protein [Silicimonas sp.]
MMKTLLMAVPVASIATFAVAKPSGNGRPGTDGTDNPGAIVGGVCFGPK